MICLIAYLAICGCAEFRASRRQPDYQDVSASLIPHPRLARRKNRVGVELFAEGNWQAAEKAFHQALIADSSFGPAHNNLGKLYFDNGDNYLAAREFELANCEMPDRPEPLNNIGLIYERVDKFDEAVNYFSQAYELHPTNPEYLGNLVRARISRGDRTTDVRDQLEELRLIENRPEWQDWAAEQLELGDLDSPYVSGPVEMHLMDHLWSGDAVITGGGTIDSFSAPLEAAGPPQDQDTGVQTSVITPIEPRLQAPEASTNKILSPLELPEMPEAKRELIP